MNPPIPRGLYGSYALLLQVTSPITLSPGSLGSFLIQPGFYVYTGSACGPGGLFARISRHLRGPQKLHWHIDYLRQVATPLEVWLAPGGANQEHSWTDGLVTLPQASQPMPGFGASDCRCPSHLVYFPTRPQLENLLQALSWRSRTTPIIQRFLPEDFKAGDQADRYS